jgi:hypothetical protein
MGNPVNTIPFPRLKFRPLQTVGLQRSVYSQVDKTWSLKTFTLDILFVKTNPSSSNLVAW